MFVTAYSSIGLSYRPGLALDSQAASRSLISPTITSSLADGLILSSSTAFESALT